MFRSGSLALTPQSKKSNDAYPLVMSAMPRFLCMSHQTLIIHKSKRYAAAVLSLDSCQQEKVFTEAAGAAQ